MLKQILMGTSTITLLFLSSLPAFSHPNNLIAQQNNNESEEIEYTDEELKALVTDFVDIVPELQKIVIDSNEEINQLIEEGGLEQDRFYEILRTSASEREAQMTQQEQEKFESINQKVISTQQSSLWKMYSIVNEEKGMTMREIRAIIERIQGDVELQEELQQMIIEVIVEQQSQES